MRFDTLVESELEGATVPITERNLNGSVDAFALTNKFKSVTLPDGEILVSVSNRKGEVGVISIKPDGSVEYKDSRGVVVAKENQTRYQVTSSTLKNYFVPKLLNDTMTGDMFGGI